MQIECFLFDGNAYIMGEWEKAPWQSIPQYWTLTGTYAYNERNWNFENKNNQFYLRAQESNVEIVEDETAIEGNNVLKCEVIKGEDSTKNYGTLFMPVNSSTMNIPGKKGKKYVLSGFTKYYPEMDAAYERIKCEVNNGSEYVYDRLNSAISDERRGEWTYYKSETSEPLKVNANAYYMIKVYEGSILWLDCIRFIPIGGQAEMN